MSCTPPQDGGNQNYYGKYRGKVLENVDPLFLGRILVEVAAVPAAVLNWAMPCSPYAGPEVGFYAIPPIGANVWVEFEGGDPNYPIWAGCFWGEGEVPLGPEGPPPPEVKIFKTAFVEMVLNDLPEIGGFTLTCLPTAVATPLSMTFDSTGITINAAPAIIKMITEEGITLEYPPGTIAMTEAAIEVAIPATTLTLTEEATALESPDVAVTAEAAIELTAGADVAIEAGGACELTAGGDAAITAGGACEMTGGGDVAVTGGGACEVTGGLDVAVTAGLACEVTAGADVAVTAVGAIELTAIGIALTGLTEATPDLLIDGQQPLVI